jgi:hypothetical protein
MNIQATGGQNPPQAEPVSLDILNGDAAENIEHVAAFVKGAMALQKEMQRFFSERIGVNFETLEQMRQCTKMTEFLDVQQKWLKIAGSTYADENVHLMAIAYKVAKWRNGSP